MAVVKNHRVIATGDGALREFEQRPYTQQENNCYYNMTREELIAFFASRKSKNKKNKEYYKKYKEEKEKKQNQEL